MKRIMILVLISMCLLSGCSEVKTNSFFNETVLNEYKLEDIAIVDSTDSKLKENILYANVDKAKYEEYVTYIFDYLKTKQNMCVGSIVEKYNDKYLIFGNKYYIKEFDEIDCYKIDNEASEYTFVYYNTEENGTKKESLECFIINISYYNNAQEVASMDYSYNFKMSLSRNSGYTRYYLLDDYHELTKVDINENNFNEYFTIEKRYEFGNDYFTLEVSPVKTDSYAVLYIDLIVSISVDKETFTKEMIVNETCRENDLFFITDSFSFFINTVNITNVEVLKGYMYCE